MDIDHTLYQAEKCTTGSCALLWDESFLWGLMAWRALREAGLPFNLLRFEDVRKGELSHYRMVFVPGGWASNKIIALGDQGAEEIRRFVAGGGNYLGICGGAGMATENGLGLLPITRKSQRERVPSFSGPIRLSSDGHTMWQGIDTPVFSVWWPSQFQVEDPNIKVLATYEEMQAGAFSADINMVDGRTLGWSELEQRYGILLDPSRLCGEPGVLEGWFGRGRVILSLVHFDTPGDRNGAAVLGNLWDILCLYRPSDFPMDGKREPGRSFQGVPKRILDLLDESQAAIIDLIAMGKRNFLWYWRNPLFLQWRRGVRGLEYSTLAVMIGEIKRHLNTPGPSTSDRPPMVGNAIDMSYCEEALQEIRGELIPFCEKAKRLLIRERLYMMNAPLSPVQCPDTEISHLRQELFGSVMSHGGQFKRLIDPIDRLLYQLIKDE